MDINSKVDHMDEELQLLKNEIKQVLLEIQEHVLNVQNPFSAGGAGHTDAFTSSANAMPEPVFTEPLIPEPEPPEPEPVAKPAPAPVAAATEISVTTQAEVVPQQAPPVPAAPVADFVPSAPAPAQPLPPAPAQQPPNGGMVGYSGPAFVPPPMPQPMPSMPSTPFIPPSGGFGGPSYSGPPPDFGDRERYRDKERELDRDRDRYRDKERELDQDIERLKLRDEDQGRVAGPESGAEQNWDQEGQSERPFDADMPYFSAANDGPFGDPGEFSSAQDRDGFPSPPREFTDVMASLEDEAGMPGLPPGDSSRRASSKGKQQQPNSDDQVGGSLGPAGGVFSLPGLNLDGKAVDLVTTAGLIQWSYSVLAKVGSEHLCSILEVSALTGRIPEETRDILLSVIPIFEMTGKAGNVTVKDIIATLAELDGFLGNISTEDTRLLPFLLQEEMEVFPLIRPR